MNKEEEKNLTEGQEVNKDQEVKGQGNEAKSTLERISELEKELAESKKYHLQYYRRSEILKAGLNALCEKKNIEQSEMISVMLEANNIDLDSLLLYLAK